MDASESALLQSSLSLVKQRFQAAVDPISPSRAWLIHVHIKGDGTPAIYSLIGDMIDSFNWGVDEPLQNLPPPLRWNLGVAAIGRRFPPFRREVRIKSSERLTPICVDAATLLTALPTDVASRLWQGVPVGTELKMGAGLSIWGMAVFELANASVVGSSLRAARQTPITEEQAKTIFAPEFKQPSDADWYEMLPDFAAASVQAIDILQSWLADELRREAEVESEPPKPVEPQAETLTGGDDTAGGRVEAIGKPAKLRPCDDKAWSQYRRAIEDNPELTTDQAAYDWFIEHVADEGESLPAFASWVKYVRLARADAGEQKNKRGVGHETRSVVPAKRL